MKEFETHYSKYASILYAIGSYESPREGPRVFHLLFRKVTPHLLSLTGILTLAPYPLAKFEKNVPKVWLFLLLAMSGEYLELTGRGRAPKLSWPR